MASARPLSFTVARYKIDSVIRWSGFSRRSAEQAGRVRDLLAAFSHNVTRWLGAALPRYARSWHLDNLLPAFFATAPPGPARGHVAAARRRGWPLKAGAGVGLLTAVLATGLALYATGSGGESLPGGSVAALTNAGTPVPQTSPRASSGSLATPTQSPSVRFDDWRYKQYAFQIYPGELGTEAKKALAGFQLNLQDEGDSVLVLLKATSARYKDAQYTVDKRDTAYFIETTMRDDPNDQENNLRDDGVIEVDAQGYIVNS